MKASHCLKPLSKNWKGEEGEKKETQKAMSAFAPRGACRFPRSTVRSWLLGVGFG